MSLRSEPIITEQSFSCSKEELWEAITSAEMMREWFFENIPDFEAQVGFETRFMVQSTVLSFEHIWLIMEVEPEARIKYHWSYEEYDGVAFVTFELSERDGQVLLTVTNEGLDTFPEEIPEFARESCQGGWDYFIKQQLVDYMAS